MYYAVMVFGIVGGVAGVVTTIMSMINKWCTGE